VSVNWIQVAIHWLVDHQWLCVVAFDFSKIFLWPIVFEEVLKEEETRKKKLNEKKKEKKAKCKT